MTGRCGGGGGLLQGGNCVGAAVLQHNNNSLIKGMKTTVLSSRRDGKAAAFATTTTLRGGGGGRRGRRERRRRVVTSASVDVDVHEIHRSMNHISDIATGVGLPCTVQNCGDVIYRSTLDPELRRELKPLLTTQGAIILSTLLAFFSITPGALPGYIEYYIVQPFQDRMRKKYTLDDFTLGSKLGEGGFGVVYFATNNETGELYVLKRADDYGEAEEWMNRRMQIAAWNACAPYVGSWQGEPAKPGEYPPLWLAWKYEGGRTLSEFMKEKNFPYNLEPYLFPDAESYPRTLEVGDPERAAATIRAIMSQSLDLLVQMHGTGIVHRDVKPENLIFDESTQRFKLIDFGGSADLRFGVNYVPKQFIFDPRYAAPEQYIMSTQTPEAPFPPLALALSPVLWQLNLPDRFDMYSLGIMFLQLCFKSLRTDAGVQKLRRDLTANNESLSAWRRANESKIRDPEAWAILDLNDQAGWEFARLLTKKVPRRRLSAIGSKFNRFMLNRPSLLKKFDRMIPFPTGEKVNADGTPAYDSFGSWLIFRVARSGTDESGGFTEAQLREFEEGGDPEVLEDARQFLGLVATEELQKYGVSKAFRTIQERDRTIVKVKSASVSFDEDDEDFFGYEEASVGEEDRSSNSKKGKGVGGLLGNLFSKRV